MNRRAWLLSAAILSLSAGVALAGDQDFTLVNNSGRQVDNVYVSKVSSNSWEEDVLGRDVLGHRRSITIRFNARERTCRWDMKVKYHGGGEDSWRNIDLCRTSKVTLYQDRTGEVQARTE